MRWAILVTVLMAIGFSYGISQSSLPPQGPPPGPIGGTPPPNEAGHILRLHQEHVATQRRILDLQSSEIDRLEKEKPEGKDEKGAQARQKLKALNVRLHRLRSQLEAIMSKRPPLPPDIARQVGRLHELGVDQAQQMREGFERLQNLVPTDAKDELPEDGGDENSSSSADSTSSEWAVPESEEEAGDVIGSGSVKTPTHLLKLFERVHTSKTPRSNLNKYRKYRSKK